MVVAFAIPVLGRRERKKGRVEPWLSIPLSGAVLQSGRVANEGGYNRDLTDVFLFPRRRKKRGRREKVGAYMDLSLRAKEVAHIRSRRESDHTRLTLCLARGK